MSTSSDNEYDLYAEDNKPRVEILGRSVSLQIVPGGRSGGAFISLQVDNLELVTLIQYRWNGVHRSSTSHEVIIPHDREVWEYLREWEYVRSVQVGEEDWEWFATRKLVEATYGISTGT